MRQPVSVAVVVAVAGVLVLSAPARAELVDRVAAVVNGEVIALSEVEARAAPELQQVVQLERDPKKRNEKRQAAMKRALDMLVGEKLLDEAAKELGVEVADQEIQASMDDVKKQQGADDDAFEQLLQREGYTLESYKGFMRRHLGRMKLVNYKVRSQVKVSDEDLKAEYARYARAEGSDFEVRARHILLPVPKNAPAAQVEEVHKKAQGLAELARKPDTDFAALAKKEGKDGTAEEGGDLGFFGRGVMVPEFERVAFNLQPGKVSDAVRSPFGWHVIKVEERRAMSVRPFEEVKDQLREQIMRQQMERYTEQYVQELRQKAIVEVML
jgi:peptidyl-prolyl cis-trans isomerase SurA